MAISPKTQSQAFPQISAPVVNENGNATLVWYQFFVSLWNRTGAGKGQPEPYIPSDVAITGGTIDGTEIGTTTPSIGDFTTIHATETITASNFMGSSSGVNTGNQTISLVGDGILFDTSVTGSPVGAPSGTLGPMTLANQAANEIFAGPTTGAPATPSFRALTIADLPSSTGTVTSFSAGNLSPLFTTSVTTAATTPALSFSLDNAPANSILGNNTGSSAPPLFQTNPIVSQIAFNTASGIIGSQTNDSAPSGSVGYETGNSSAITSVNLSTGTVANLTSVSLPAGDWDVWGSAYFEGATGTVSALYTGWISTTSATDPGPPNGGAFVANYPGSSTAQQACIPVGQMRLSLSTTTTVYLSAIAYFSVSTMTGGGAIYARLRR